MAPERVPTLVVWDLIHRVDDELKGPLEYIETKEAGDLVTVDWDSTDEPEGYREVGSGVAYVKLDKIHTPVVHRNAPAPSVDPFRYRWEHTPDPDDPGAALILVLPEGYTLSFSKPKPIKAKKFGTRLALLWVLGKDQTGTVQIEWGIKEFKGDLLRAARDIRRKYAKGKMPAAAAILLAGQHEAAEIGGSVDMSRLIAFATQFKGFLAFAALIFLGLILTVSYLFSAGSFDQVLAGFGNLSPNQFLSIVYAALGLPFVIILLLIILSFRATSQEKRRYSKPQSGLIYVIVHEAEDKTRGIADAEVRLMLPEPRVTRTDANGGARFAFPAEFTGESYLVNASKAGYLSGRAQRVKMTHGQTATVSLKRVPREDPIQVEPRAEPGNQVLLNARPTAEGNAAEWQRRVEEGFEPIPFESATADGTYGNKDAPVGKRLIGKENIPYSLVPHPGGQGHRIIEVRPKHARDQDSKAIRPAEIKNALAIYVLLSAGDTRRIRGEQRFEKKEIGHLAIYFADGQMKPVSLRLGIEVREWVSGDATWDVVTEATSAVEVWRSPDQRCIIDMLKVEIPEGPREIRELAVVGECPWLPNDFREPLPSIRISGVTYQIAQT